MPELSATKMAGLFTQEQHHKIAAVLQAISDDWDKQEALTGIRPADAYDYSLGLVMGKVLIFGAPLDKIADLEQKITMARSVK